MKVRELTASDIALFSRLIMDSSEFDTLTDLERRECESALTAAKAVVELLSADGNSIFKKEYQLNGIAYNQDYAIKLKSPIEIPKNLGKGACLRISIEKNDGGKLATDFEIKN